jgi:DNA-binding transcriptional regulator YiaG
MKQRRTKTGRYLQQHHIDYIKEHGSNLTIAQISEAMGFSQSTVSAWCKQLKVKPTKSCFQFNKPEIPKCEP